MKFYNENCLVRADILNVAHKNVRNEIIGWMAVVVVQDHLNAFLNEQKALLT